MSAYAEAGTRSTVTEHGAQAGIISPEIGMMILTYVTFFIVLGVLYKIAWKPILSTLNQREETIRKSLEDARLAQIEIENVHQNTKHMIAEADKQAKFIVERSKKAAVEAARVIEHEAKKEANIIMNNALNEINTMKGNAHMSLREESVDLALALTEKVIKQELDPEKHDALVNQLVRELRM